MAQLARVSAGAKIEINISLFMGFSATPNCAAINRAVSNVGRSFAKANLEKSKEFAVISRFMVLFLVGGVA